MPPVGLKYVVSFSSQDEKHPVTNLITGEGYKKWLCHPQERSGSIEAVFQLEQSCCISYLDIGSIWCATLEIQVGRSDWPAGREFETLVYTVSLMTPSDCSLNKNPMQTKMFSSDLFCPLVAKQQWDRVKVICKQPYRKLIQFGLSFIRVKTADAVPSVKQGTGDAQQMSSVKSIQKHFFGKVSNGLSPSHENLKSKLLKIAGTAENGAEHDGSLSRTAKLVLAASGSTSGPTPSLKNQPPENRHLHSNHIEQKYGPKFEDEAKEFFLNLSINESELDKITIADIRHKFERKKRRKLTKEEKKIFRDMAEEFISEKFGANDTENKQNTKPLPNANKSPIKSVQSQGHNLQKYRARIANEAETSTSIIGKERNSEVKSKPVVKRKLEDVEPSTPVAKFKRADTIVQKLKSPENIKPFAERTNGETSVRKVNMPVILRTEITPAIGAFQYKGLRGGEDPISDIDSPLLTNKTGDSSQNFEKSENVCVSPGDIKKGPDTSSSSMDFSWLPDLIDNGFETEIVCADEKFNTKRGRGKRGRGRGAGGGRGRRGRGQKNLASVLDDTADVVSPAGQGGRGRGRGRGRGSGRGRGRKKNEATSSSTVVVDTSPPKSPPRAPRGFIKCSGCNEFFGEMLLSAHQQRCPSLKNKPNQTTLDSPWLCARKPESTSVSPPVQPSSTPVLGSGRNDTGKKKSEDTTAESINSSISERNDRGSNSDSELRSPPWLLAAERRLRLQQSSSTYVQSCESVSGVYKRGNTLTGSDSNDKGSSARKAFLDAQEKQLEKCRSVSDCAAGNSTTSNRNTCTSTSSFIGNSNSTRGSFGKACHSIDLTAESDGDDDDELDDDHNDDLDGFIVNDNDIDDDNADYNPNISSQVFDSDGTSDSDGGHYQLSEDFRVGSIQIECPLCGDFFPETIIQMHAATCYL